MPPLHLPPPLPVQADEAVAQGVPRLPVADNVARGDAAKAREDDLQILLCGYLRRGGGEEQGHGGRYQDELWGEALR